MINKQNLMIQMNHYDGCGISICDSLDNFENSRTHRFEGSRNIPKRAFNRSNRGFYVDGRYY